MMWLIAVATAVLASVTLIELEARSRSGREFIERINNPWSKTK